MKKAMALLLPVILSVYLPVCSIGGLAACLADRYVPQDLQNSFDYGTQWLGLFWKTYAGDSESVAQEPEAEEQAIPLATMAQADVEFDCPESRKGGRVLSAAAPESIEVIAPAPIIAGTPQSTEVSVHLSEPIALAGFDPHEFQSHMKVLVHDQLQLKELEMTKQVWEKHRIEMEQAMREAHQQMERELRLNQAKSRKALRILVKSKSSVST